MMVLLLAPGLIALRLAGLVLFVAAAGTVGYLGQHVAGPETLVGRFFQTLRRLFRLNAEGNISSWYAAALLLACAALLALIAVDAAATRGPFARRWWLLAAIFTFLSLDESIGIHESLDGWAQATLGASGALLYVWVIPYTLFALVVALAYLRLVVALPDKVRRSFVLAGALYVGGAVGFEPIQGYLTTTRGQGGALFAALVAIEEVMEMLGIVLFIYGLLSYLAARHSRVEFWERSRRPDRTTALAEGAEQRT